MFFIYVFLTFKGERKRYSQDFRTFKLVITSLIMNIFQYSIIRLIVSCGYYRLFCKINCVNSSILRWLILRCALLDSYQGIGRSWICVYCIFNSLAMKAQCGSSVIVHVDWHMKQRLGIQMKYYVSNLLTIPPLPPNSLFMK